MWADNWAYVTPLLLVGMLMAVIVLWRTKSDEARIKHLLSQYVPIQAMYLVLSLNSRVLPNWIAPSLITGIVLLVAFWRRFVSDNPRWRGAVIWSVGMCVVISIFLHVAAFLPIPRKIDVFHKAEGWADFARHLDQDRRVNQADLLIGSYYTQASMMQFYLPDHPVTYLPPAPYGATQFTLWPGYEVGKTTRALYVANSPRLPKR